MILVLLIITFPVTPPYHGHFGNLPRSLHAAPLLGAMRNDAMRMTLTGDGRYFFGGTQITLEQVDERVHTAIEGGAERQVFLAVDRRAKYRNVKVVADEIRRGGVVRVSFLTE